MLKRSSLARVTTIALTCRPSVRHHRASAGESHVIGNSTVSLLRARGLLSTVGWCARRVADIDCLEKNDVLTITCQQSFLCSNGRTLGVSACAFECTNNSASHVWIRTLTLCVHASFKRLCTDFLTCASGVDGTGGSRCTNGALLEGGSLCGTPEVRIGCSESDVPAG